VGTANLLTGSEWVDRVERYEAVHANGSSNAFFTDPHGAWTVSTPSFHHGTHDFIPSIYYYESFTPPFPSRAVLSTNTTHAPLRFAVPPRAEFMQWYGTVSPEQGAFELRLLPRDPVPGGRDAFEIDERVISSTAARPVSAIEQLRAVAYLDPRVRYDGELVLVQEGKRADVHGLFFTSYVEEADKLQAPWYRLYDEQVARGYRGETLLGAAARVLVSDVRAAGEESEGRAELTCSCASCRSSHSLRSWCGCSPVPRGGGGGRRRLRRRRLEERATKRIRKRQPRRSRCSAVRRNERSAPTPKQQLWRGSPLNRRVHCTARIHVFAVIWPGRMGSYNV
jgi:hypothetical protein